MTTQNIKKEKHLLLTLQETEDHNGVILEYIAINNI